VLAEGDTRPAKYFAYMDILDTNPPSALVSWNGKHAGTHAQTYLGALIRRRNCWTNKFPMVGLGYSRAKLCIGPAGVAHAPDCGAVLARLIRINSAARGTRIPPSGALRAKLFGEDRGPQSVGLCGPL
jgi:hypothetical protein